MQRLQLKCTTNQKSNRHRSLTHLKFKTWMLGSAALTCISTLSQTANSILFVCLFVFLLCFVLRCSNAASPITVQSVMGQCIFGNLSEIQWWFSFIWKNSHIKTETPTKLINLFEYFRFFIVHIHVYSLAVFFFTAFVGALLRFFVCYWHELINGILWNLVKPASSCAYKI